MQNAVICLLFGIALLGGAIANAVYASDNQDLYDDTRCSENYYLKYISEVQESCDDLQTVYTSEAAAAVSWGPISKRHRCIHSS